MMVRMAALALLIATAPMITQAATPPANLPSPKLSLNPFASHRLVLQLSDGSASRQKLVLSVANTVLKRYGPDRVAVDVVAFGPGVTLLFASSPERMAVDSLIAQGVRFDVCMNTINTIRRRTGHAPALNPKAKQVPYGVPRIMSLVAHGYILVRP